MLIFGTQSSGCEEAEWRLGETEDAWVFWRMVCCEPDVCVPPGLHTEGLNPCDAIWRWGLQKVIGFRWGHEGRCPLWWDLCLSKKRRYQDVPLGHDGHSEKAPIWKPGRGPAPRAKSHVFAVSEQGEINICCSNSPVCSFLVGHAD